MVNNQHINFLKQAFVKNIIIIIIVGILCSIALGIEKTYFTNFVVQSGDYVSTTIIRINDGSNYDKSNIEFDYKALLNTTSNLGNLLDKTDKIIDYNKFNANWSTLDNNEKIQWFQKEINITPLNKGVYEITFTLDKNVPKNVNYVKKNINEFLTIYLQQSEESVQKIYPDAHIEIINSKEIMPNVTEINKKTIVVKYAIIGFILGAMACTLIVFVISLAKRREK